MEEHTPLTAHFEYLVRENKRLKINERWLMEQMDIIHRLLCPGQIETWQGRTRQVVEKIKDLTEKTAILDITKIRTVEDINSTDFSKYADEPYPSWIKLISAPTSSDDLDRICALSEQPESKVNLSWEMGELYYEKTESE